MAGNDNDWWSSYYDFKAGKTKNNTNNTTLE